MLQTVSNPLWGGDTGLYWQALSIVFPVSSYLVIFLVFFYKSFG